MLTGVETDYDKIRYFLREIKGITGITSIHSYLSEQLNEVIIGFKDKIVEENINLKKFLELPIDYSPN